MFPWTSLDAQDASQRWLRPDGRLHVGMRIVKLIVRGVGGLADGDIVMPDAPVAALAGANGTGKSKLLACLLSPWSQQVPTPREGEASDVAVQFKLSSRERSAIENLSVTAGWGALDLSEHLTVRTVLQPLVGIQRSFEPHSNVTQLFWGMQAFLQEESSLNVIYLPAERRLLPPNQSGIDLTQLSDAIAWQKNAESRGGAQNYGRLDDQEFEQFAKALCVAHSLPSEGSVAEVAPALNRVEWPEFVRTVDALIAPKKLLPLTREHPDQLRIQTSSGQAHSVQELSSGERQALIIISRVLRAGVGHTIVLIDEPDAYLHPHLSQRLIQALERGVGEDGQLVVATHSPAILDAIAPSAILRLAHEDRPRLVADESERIDLYRSAGFRASALTQSDLLLITEGESDVSLLSLMHPALGRASIRSAGGRARVVREVEQLRPYELPVLGVVDGDTTGGVDVSGVVSWPAADIEGVFLGDDLALEVMLGLGLIRAPYQSVTALRRLLKELLDGLHQNVVAELAQNTLRAGNARKWPTPKGDLPLERLRSSVIDLKVPSNDDVEKAIADAEAQWSTHSQYRWALVRGKYVLGDFTSRASEMRSGTALLEAVARQQPLLSGMELFRRDLSLALAEPGRTRTALGPGTSGPL